MAETEASSGVVGRLNTKRYFWIIMGYYLFTVYIRKVSGDSNASSHMDILEATESSGHGGTHGSEHGIQIAKLDFVNVETPFIIALWIFCASLAKIGEQKKISFFFLFFIFFRIPSFCVTSMKMKMKENAFVQSEVRLISMTF